MKLRTDEQLVLIQSGIGASQHGVQRPGFSDVADIKSLAPALLTPSVSREVGGHATQPVLVRPWRVPAHSPALSPPRGGMMHHSRVPCARR